MTLALDSIHWRRAPDLFGMSWNESRRLFPPDGVYLVEDQGVCSAVLDEKSLQLCWENWITKERQEIQTDDLYMPLRREWLVDGGGSPLYLTWSLDDQGTMPEEGELCLVLEHGLRRCVRLYDIQEDDVFGSPLVGFGWSSDVSEGGGVFPDKYENGKCWLPVEYLTRERPPERAGRAPQPRPRIHAADWRRLGLEDRRTWPDDGDVCIVKRAGLRRFGTDEGRLHWDSAENGHVWRGEETLAWDGDEFIIINYEE
jgi:hypothetical protein